MKLRDLLLSFALGGAVFAGISHALRQDGGEQEFTPAQAGPEHELLAAMVGEWTAKVSMEGETSSGKLSNTLEMNGLWLVARYEGQMFGQEFTGLGLTGYDSAKEKYVGLWIDSMSTALEPSNGTYDEAKKELVMKQSMANPMTGEAMEMTHVTRMKNRDQHSFHMLMPGPDGAEMEVMKIEYTRKK